MTDFYVQLIEKSGFSEALVRRAIEFSKTVDMESFSRSFFDETPFVVEKTGVLSFKEAFYPYNFYSLMQNVPLACETSALYIYISLSERSYKAHIDRGLDEIIFFDTMKSIFDASKIYAADTGKDGVYDYHFLANHIRGNIQRLGVFEYQYGSFDDKKVIILHVPDRADMNTANRIFSYNLARRYFGNFPIVGDSWLLYPEHKKMLPEDSNIVDFMGDFDIVSVSETTDYSELFHVFGRIKDYSYENLPKSTSLQKAYAERVKNNLPVGSAVGKLKY